MIRHLEITQLVENTAGGPGLLAEHGAALYIEADDRRLLFDTGQGMTLLHNTERLGIALERLDTVVLSHGHYDHSGGLTELLALHADLDLYLHPEALAPKFNRDGRAIGAPRDSLGDLDDLAQRVRRLHANSEPTSIAPGILLTGEIPRRHAIEDTGGPFYADAERGRLDPIPDDQALVIATPSGSVVVLGCGHAGVVNTLDHIQQLTDARPIHAVIGGMHLLRASPERLAFTLDAFERLDVARVAPNHCTGLAAICAFRARFPTRVLESPVGTRHRLV